ncbi:helix-turn-helix transcriptional regulator [Rhodopseudomonas sp. RCAM05734]|uniref:helix-turn-helix transcriptional regulator n=1 Tax=Rhodopseudomonas sp. RCAM05734 TaxID=3457549 RepID=UPI0040440E86
MRAVKGEVLAQLGRDNLSAETIALSLRISANYVRKLFQIEGLSFSEYVLGLRLERALAMLHDPRLAGRTISSIAMAAGFSDISYFNRSFRRRFGMTPSEARNQD